MVSRFLLLFVILFLPLTSFAQPIQVVTEEWPPYNYTQNGTNIGVVTRVVRAVLDRAGVEYTIRSYPWARAYDMAAGSNGTLIYSIVRLPSREAHFKWIKIEGLTINMNIYQPKYRTDIELNTLDDARHYKIGITRESSTHHYLREHGFIDYEQLFPVNQEFQNILKSKPDAKRVDLTTGDTLSVQFWLYKAGLPSDYWVPKIQLFSTDIYMAFGSQTPDTLVERVRKACRELTDNGFIQNVLDGNCRD